MGFGLYGIEQDSGSVKVFRLMIGRNFQHRGFGTAAMRVRLREIAERWSGVAVYVSYQSENAVARRLYERLGLRETERHDNKVTACRRTVEDQR